MCTTCLSAGELSCPQSPPLPRQLPVGLGNSSICSKESSKFIRHAYLIPRMLLQLRSFVSCTSEKVKSPKKEDSVEVSARDTTANAKGDTALYELLVSI